MFGERNWKILVLVTGVLLAQAIDSPGRGPPKLQHPKNLRNIYIHNDNNFRRQGKSIPETYTEEEYEELPGARRSQVTFRDDTYPEATNQGRQSSKITFEDNDYNEANENEDRRLTNYQEPISQRGYSDEYANYHVGFNEAQFARRRPPFPLKSYHRYPIQNPFFAPPKSFSPDFNEGFFNAPPFQGEFTPVFGTTGFAPKTPPTTSNTQPFWKTRTPRVVFPYGNENGVQFQSNSHQGGTGNSVSNGINYNNDNVVFRDQNFGLNELAAVQDVRNDFNLQDLGTSTTGDDSQIRDREKVIIDKGKYLKTEHRFKRNKFEAKKPTYFKYVKVHPKKEVSFLNNTHLKSVRSFDGRRPKTLQYIIGSRPKSSPFLYPNPPLLDREPVEFTTPKLRTTQKRQDEENCAQGGTCEFFLYCWMSGGLLDGSCGGLLKGCCHRLSKNGALGVQDSNSLDNNVASSVAPFDSSLGVINDNSKSSMCCLQ